MTSAPGIAWSLMNTGLTFAVDVLHGLEQVQVGSNVERQHFGPKAQESQKGQ